MCCICHEVFAVSPHLDSHLMFHLMPGLPATSGNYEKQMTATARRYYVVQLRHQGLQNELRVLTGYVLIFNNSKKKYANISSEIFKTYFNFSSADFLRTLSITKHTSICHTKKYGFCHVCKYCNKSLAPELYFQS